MAKPDPAQLDPARYPFHCEMQTRFADLDINNHVNNVALYSLHEDARVRFHGASGYHVAVKAGVMSTMVASSTIEYLGQAFYPGPLVFHIGAVTIGRTSYRLQQLVTQAGNAVSLLQATMVCVKDGRPVPVPDLYRKTVADWMVAA